jgi:hypothetical protein
MGLNQVMVCQLVFGLQLVMVFKVVMVSHLIMVMGLLQTYITEIKNYTNKDKIDRY